MKKKMIKILPKVRRINKRVANPALGKWTQTDPDRRWGQTVC